MDGVDRKAGETFHKAARPAYFDRIDFSSRAKAEMNAHVAVGYVTGAAPNFVNKNASSGFDGDTSADGGSRGSKASGRRRSGIRRRAMGSNGAN